MRIKNLPLIAPLQRWIIDRFLASDEFVHTINAGPAKGLNCRIKLPEDKALWMGTYEREFAGELARCVRRGSVCLDIGGYHGFFAGVCALAEAKVVHVFEPLADNCQKIRSLIECNPNLNIKLHQLALGAEKGGTEFLVMPEQSMGKLASSAFQSGEQEERRIKVEVDTLDSLAASGLFSAVDLVKIDVEGAEALVLRGGTQFLQAQKPLLFIEIHSRALARECNDLLCDLHYAVRALETGEAPNYVSEPEICHLIVNRID
jgi:FkbM family methyltransferase